MHILAKQNFIFILRSSLSSQQKKSEKILVNQFYYYNFSTEKVEELN